MLIKLKGIQIYAHHGVHAFEREHGGRFEIDVELDADLASATEADDIAQTIDYVKVQEAVRYLATTKRFNLIETLAAALCDHLLQMFSVSEVIVRVRKPGAAVGGILETIEVECRKKR